jgi:transposase InsO family protein
MGLWQMDSEVLFDRICRENGISHRLTAVRSPATTGRVERFHQSLRREFLQHRIANAASQNTRLKGDDS